MLKDGVVPPLSVSSSDEEYPNLKIPLISYINPTATLHRGSPPMSSTPWGEAQAVWPVLLCSRVWLFFHFPPENVRQRLRGRPCQNPPQLRSPVCEWPYVFVPLPIEHSLVPLTESNSVGTLTCLFLPLPPNISTTGMLAMGYKINSFSNALQYLVVFSIV